MFFFNRPGSFGNRIKLVFSFTAAYIDDARLYVAYVLFCVVIKALLNVLVIKFCDAYQQ